MALISNGSTIFDNGSMASGFGGNMVFIKKLTASQLLLLYLLLMVQMVWC
jgi:hypothetical protein